MTRAKEGGRLVREPAPGRPEVSHQAFLGRIGIARSDMTPPVGIYARNWGAAEHDRAESIHRPLAVTALTLAADNDQGPLVLLDFDLGWWRNETLFSEFRRRLLEQLGLPSAQLIIAVSHTHSTVTLTDPDPNLPGSDLLEGYYGRVARAAREAAEQAIANATEAVLDWQVGRCGLAANRDFPDPSDGRQRVLCGYNPHGRADDTLLVGRVTDSDGVLKATLVNYACHPTTLAWENKAISPDFVGAMRETIESAGGAPALFLQGASGDLAPRYQYVGDTSVADRHGRQLGYAVLAALQGMEPPATRLVFDRVVESGAPLAVWRHKSVKPSRKLLASEATVDVPLKEWPSAEQLEQQQRTCEDRALQERLRRKRDIRRTIGDESTFPLPIWVWRIGDVLLIGSRAEAYSRLQLDLRNRFPDQTLICMNLINGSIGYLPPDDAYDTDVYQAWQTPFARGGLEATIDGMAGLLDAMFRQERRESPS